MINLTSEEWEDQFIPIMEGESYKDFHPKIINPEDKITLKEAILENRVWTLVEDDNNNLVLLNGMHVVNRLDVYITKMCYNEKDVYEIYWED